MNLDQGACRALLNKGASLLLVGVTDLDGEFEANQAVLLLDENGQEVARGLATMSSERLRSMLTETACNLNKTGGSPVVVHRDAMVLTKSFSRQE